MAKVILAFFVVLILFHFGIQAVRSMTGKERWSMVKGLTYSFILATITLVALTVIVVLF